jgi:PAS domain S-box-containing protein
VNRSDQREAKPANMGVVNGDRAIGANRVDPRGYGVAVAAVAAVWLLRWLFAPVLAERFPFLTFILAVVIAAWYGGLRPGLLALALSIVLAVSAFPASADAAVADRVNVLVGLALFAFVGVATAVLSGSARRAQRGLVTEVHERRDSESKAHEQREWLQVTLSSIGDAVIATDTDGRITFLNGAAQSLTGWQASEATGQPAQAVFRIVNEETRQPPDDPVQRALREGRVVGLANNTVLIAKDGSERPIDDSAAPIRDERGAVIGVVLVFRSIAERRQAAEIRSQLATIVDSMDDAVITKDLDGIILSWNGGAERLYQYRAEEVIGQPISLLIPPEQPDELPAIMARFKRGERVDHYETTRVRKDGTRLDISVTISPIRDPHGRIIAAAAVARDISDRRRAERIRNARVAVAQVLAESQSLADAGPRILQAVGEALAWDYGGLWLVDDHARVLRCAEVWVRGGLPLAEFASVSHDRTFTSGTGLPGRVWLKGLPAWIVDVATDDNFPRAAIADRAGLHGALAYPIVLGGQVVGVIEFFSRDVRAPDTDLLDMMATIGGQIGQFIERRTAEAQLSRSEQELSDFFENASVGAHWAGPDGIILRANQAELDMLGYERDEYVGHHVAEFHADQDVINDIQRRLERAETVRDCEARMRCKDGTIKTVLIDASVMRGEDGRFIHTRCFTRDLSDRKRLERELEQHIAELAAVDRRKNEFLATLSHELRNPLAPIRNALELMQLGGDDPQALANARGIIERQAQHLVRLVDDLLDVSRIASGKIGLRRERLALHAAIEGAVETSRPLIQAAGHTLTVVEPPEPIYLHGDATRLAQVFANLLNNAAKYTDSGGRISLTVERCGGEAVVSVEDTGVGISAQSLPTIFDMFTQVDPTPERQHGGLGIGLALVQALVTLHGGTVEAHSGGPGKGSRFVVRLPMLSRPPDAQVGKDEQPPAPDAIRRRVLVADDNRDSADSLALLLEMMGNETRAVYDGEAAVEAAAAFHPDVILLDIGLPKMSGLDAARRIRAESWGRSALLVAMTGWGQEEDRRRSREAGFDAHYTKPLEPDVLRRLIAGEA